MARIEDFTQEERDLLAEAGSYRRSNPGGNRLLNLVAKLADLLKLTVTEQDVEPREVQGVGARAEAPNWEPTKEQTERGMASTEEVLVTKDARGRDKILTEPVKKNEQ